MVEPFLPIPLAYLHFHVGCGKFLKSVSSQEGQMAKVLVLVNLYRSCAVYATSTFWNFLYVRPVRRALLIPLTGRRMAGPKRTPEGPGTTFHHQREKAPRL